jgi:hypothetical protein
MTSWFEQENHSHQLLKSMEWTFHIWCTNFKELQKPLLFRKDNVEKGFYPLKSRPGTN